MERIEIGFFNPGMKTGVFTNGDVTLVLESEAVERVLKQIREPFYFAEDRLLRISRGRGTGRVNLMDYEVAEHDVLLLPAQSIMEPLYASDDFTAEALILKSMPDIPMETVRHILANEVVHLHLEENDWQRHNAFIALLADMLSARQSSADAIGYQVAAMMCDLKNIRLKKQPIGFSSNVSHGKRIFQQFLALANIHGYCKRRIDFYASELLLTPNHLSAIVRQQSGRTVLDWLNDRTIMEAKIQLKNSDRLIYEISDTLCFTEPSAFIRYFKKSVGMTPLEYREGK